MPQHPRTLADTDALNRICAAINNTGLSGADAYMEIANLIADTGRPVVDDAIHITARVRHDDYGLPIANVDTDQAGITVTVYQNIRPHGIAVEITTEDGTDPSDLSVEINGTSIYNVTSENTCLNGSK
ncbi:hypothetical protein [Micromonospora sp. CPCC 206061]|uniref:hypothetical protein n=1 Tax=Micromonospora sp. CPCC 206061 TaxID=3122410 RepID=UPI002FF3DECC